MNVILNEVKNLSIYAEERCFANAQHDRLGTFSTPKKVSKKSGYRNGGILAGFYLECRQDGGATSADTLFRGNTFFT